MLQAKEWGWTGVILFTGTILALAGLLILILLPEYSVDVTPTEDDQTIIVAPSTGVGGFDVGPFCNDPETKVIGFPIPDVQGLSYQLTRVDNNGVVESVAVIYGRDGKLNQEFTRHFYETTVGPDGELAYITDDAKKCIDKKVKVDAPR